MTLARVRRAGRRPAARHRAGHPRRRRPGRAGPYASPSAAAPATASSTHVARRGRRRLPHRRPAPPPGLRGPSRQGGPALVDAAHWATEWPWCEQAPRQLDEISDRHGWDLRSTSPRTVTDPWTHTRRPRTERERSPRSPERRLLDLTDLDVRSRPARAPAPHACPSTPRSTSSPPSARPAARPARRAQTEESDTAREQTKAEQDVDQVRPRRPRPAAPRLRRVTSPKDLENLQREIASLAKRQGDLEDVVLEVMERRESAQERVAELTRRARRARPRPATPPRTAATPPLAEIDAEASEVQASARSSPPTSPPTCSSSTTSSATSTGSAPPALYQRRCEGCRLELNITELNEIQAAAPDAVRPLRELPPHPGAYRRVRPVTCRSSSRPTAAPGATRGPPATARSSATRRPARCWPRRPSTSASRPTTSPSTGA